MRRSFAAAAVALLVAGNLLAQTKIVPTTTLAAETANNTSAADTFTTQTNGNLGATNVSKVDIRTLLYPGATTPVYVHFMPWFGQTSHMDVGYNSNDPNQVRRQVDDLLSRGITGAIVDWYGPNKTFNNTTTLVLMQEAELRNGQFMFSVQEDKGALKACAGTAGCDVTQQLISDLTYAYNTFEGSPAYMRIGGRPVVSFFDVDSYPITWSTVVASVPGDPLFIFRNSGGFTHSYTSGSFAWIILTSDPNNWNASYLDNFYLTALQHPGLHTYGATYKGFNDTLASWGSNRIMNQNCGQTWLNTFAEIGKYYSSANQLEFLQIDTWNDYEEGSELESGIDNCVTISGATTGNTLSWSLTGQENTVDHYTVFISADGTNLMALGDFAAGSRSLDLSSYGFSAGSYTLYIKAVGKPSMKNQMSAAISYGGTKGNQPPIVALYVTPTSGMAPLTVSATVTASDPEGTAVTSRIDFGDGTVVAGTSGTHTYTSAGTYTITATATDADNLQASATATVTAGVDLPPVVTIGVTPSSGVAPLSVTASMAGTADPDGSISAYSIDFGDGTVVIGDAASHTYSAAGTYTVRGTATDNGGLTANATATVTVSAPVAYVVTVTSPTNGATVGSPVHFVATTTSPYPVTGMKIYVDSVSAYATTAASIDTNLALAVGTHAVTVKAWNTTGAIAAQKLTITVVDQPPVVSLAVTPTPGIAPLAVTATATASDSDGTIASTSINFGDGTTVSGASASHTYNSAGTYTVTATATDNAGLKATATTTVTVTAANQPPTASLAVTPSSGTAPLTVTATVSASDPDGSIASTSINFGDGTLVSGASASHTYSSAGTYTVTATVTDNAGLKATATATVSVTAPLVTSGVRIISPVKNGTYGSPVRVTAAAGSSLPITAMTVYVDGISRYTVSAASLDTYLSMTTGSHRLTVCAWDTSGTVFKSTIRITVE